MSLAASGTLVWDGPITALNSNVTIAKSGAGTLFMGTNSCDGPFAYKGSGAAGAIVVDSIGNIGGGPSSLGAPTTAAADWQEIARQLMSAYASLKETVTNGR